MTDIDTAEYRRRLVADELGVADIDPLLDALDAATARIAELEVAAHWGLAGLSRVSAEIDHARTVELEIDLAVARAGEDNARTRIAAALAEFGERPRREYMSNVEYKVYRALTGVQTT